MNKRALHIKKYITTILLLVFFFPMQKTTAQKKSPDQSIQLIVGSYKYELNALILKRKLIKEGFKEVKVLKKTNGLYRVSINQLASKEEVDKFINTNNLDKDHYWLLYTNRSVVKQTPSKPKPIAIKSDTNSIKKVKQTSAKTKVVESKTPNIILQKKKDTQPKVGSKKSSCTKNSKNQTDSKKRKNDSRKSRRTNPTADPSGAKGKTNCVQ